MAFAHESGMPCLFDSDVNIAWCSFLQLITHVSVPKQLAIECARYNLHFEIFKTANNFVAIAYTAFATDDLAFASTSGACLSHHVVVATTHCDSLGRTALTLAA